ncbi:DUF262 domain-containing protein [Nocardioides perillae]|uniref:GmrSD restriction endonucleases N-terminal domain-containing protein n=1 Tax=Nocardioides perillae TaxID=1119534 RepID=A0A7Y9RVB4_9ACTN|nr:DUF262 domain-containing protein [Nocardioides perillae]NYG55277.1 hypothetical protein [Nocardioides perillae]
MDATLEPRLVIQGRAGVPYVEGDFLVAAYQRGYRWGRDEVRALLDDIAANERDAEAEDRKVSDYFLQPIVVIRRDNDPAVKSWELVDGQQRLTTLYLIVKYIQRHLPSAKLSYRLSYETREDSATFLDSLDPGLADSNIDYRHIATAYAEIERWFEEQGNAGLAATSMHTALAKWVYVIWYEAPTGTAATDLFIRLNRDRIPLTESELVKALVLSSSGVERREEVAAQWDRFELDLRDRPLWAFLTGSDSEPGTYIDFLLETIPAPSGTGEVVRDDSRHWLFGRARDHIQSRGVETFWSAVVAHHGLLTGWFKDHELYHRIGYLVAIGDTIADLVTLSRDLTHSAFRKALEDRTRQRLGLSSDDVSLLRYGKSAKADRDCTRVLLLMNVETVLASADPANRFSFHAYAAAGWSLEHIHAQRSESPNDEKGRREWLAMHQEKIAGQPWPSDSLQVVDPLLADITTHLARPLSQVDEPGFERLRDRVITLFDAPDSPSDDDTHSLGNLALLQRDINSMLNNAVFALKRDRMLKLDKQGVYLLPCTRNVFLKYYTSGTEHASLWGAGDRESYYDEMVRQVRSFLTDAPGAVADETVEADQAATKSHEEASS